MSQSSEETPDSGQLREEGRSRFALSGLSRELAEIREPPSFSEWFGSLLANRLLWVICGLIVLFLASWWWTLPSLQEVREVLGDDATPDQVVATWRELRGEHLGVFRELFQLVVLSTLVPLFTLLAGYAFGSRQRENQK